MNGWIDEWMEMNLICGTDVTDDRGMGIDDGLATNGVGD